MDNLLETVIEAHGGLERWSQLEAVSVHGVNGGALWALKGQAGVLDDVFVRAKPAPRAGITPSVRCPRPSERLHPRARRHRDHQR
jgi:hypothetical protein